MADQSDVEAALVAVIGGALYPGGLSGPCAVAGAMCRIYRGWPVPAALDADLAAGTTNVSVVAIAGQSRNTTRWPDSFVQQTQTVPTLSATVSGTTVTFGGVGGAGQVAAVIADTAWAAWRLQATDTPQSVAAALARVLSNARSASSSGATLTVPGAIRLIGRVEADQPTLRLSRRQLQAFRATAWCADPATRDAVGSAVDAALSGIDFIGLADGTSGRLRYVASVVSDRWEDATLYRRELTYTVDYPTSILLDLPRMAIGAFVPMLGEGGLTETLLS
jgi:hypothetical protein